MSALFEDSELTRADADRDLPPLRGTGPQVRWAAIVRAGKFRHIDALLRDWRLLVERHREGGREKAADREQQAYRAALDGLGRLERQTSAGFWIDAKDMEARELLNGVGPPADPRFPRRG